MRRAKRRGLRSQQLLTRHFRVARVESGRLRPARRLRAKERPRRLARPRTPPFHGDNTGSNPVGDANKRKDLIQTIAACRRPITSNKTALSFPILLSWVKYEPCDLAVSASLNIRHSLSVEIHGHAAIRMPQQLLYRLNVFSVRFKDRRVRM